MTILCLPLSLLSKYTHPVHGQRFMNPLNLVKGHPLFIVGVDAYKIGVHTKSSGFLQDIGRTGGISLEFNTLAHNSQIRYYKMERCDDGCSVLYARLWSIDRGLGDEFLLLALGLSLARRAARAPGQRQGQDEEDDRDGQR